MTLEAPVDEAPPRPKAKSHGEDWAPAEDNPAAGAHVDSSTPSAGSSLAERSSLDPASFRECALALAGAKRRVLVVDDSPLCQKILARILSGADMDVQLASNGAEALELLRIEPQVWSQCSADLAERS